MKENNKALWSSYTKCNTASLVLLYERCSKKLIAGIEALKNKYTFEDQVLKYMEAKDLVHDFFEDLIIQKDNYVNVEIEKRFVDFAYYRIKQKLRSNRGRDIRRKEIDRMLGWLYPDEAKPWTSDGIEEIEICLKNLSVNHQKIINCVIQGLTNEEICVEMNKDDASVRREKSRARKRIKDCLDKLEDV